MNKLLSMGSLTLKVLVIAILILLMLIPIGMVKSIINERESVKASVKTDITSKWGAQQEFTGPVLVLPYKSNSSTDLELAYFLPSNFNVKGENSIEEQTESIYKIPCFHSVMKVNGKFDFPDIDKLGLTNENIIWNDAFVIIGVSHLRGIKNKIVFNWNNTPKEALSGLQPNSIIKSGLKVNVPIANEDKSDAKGFNFDFELVLNGTDSLFITPIGKETHIEIMTNSKNTSYLGAFLPIEEKKIETGTNIKWDIFDYNRIYPQMWTGENSDLKKSSVGISFLNPIDQYRQTMRAIKYAVMIISLTFIAFFLVELVSKTKRIHPIQYLLISFALVLFYCLLLSISEFLSFGVSFLIAATFIILLITGYSHTILKDIKQTLLMFVFLTILYIFLYIILQAENMSLLLGSLGLFVALAVIMFITRKINWYKNNNNNTPPPYNNNTPPPYNNNNDEPYYDVHKTE